MARYFWPLRLISCSLFLLAISTLWPIGANQSSGLQNQKSKLIPPPRQYLKSRALQQWSQHLTRHRYNLNKQSILVESLDGQTVLAQLNPEIPLNPASVMKLATSLIALERLGPNHRFLTRVYGDTSLDKKTKTLSGNLYVVSDGNPVLRKSDINRLTHILVRNGLHRLDGDLVMSGPFSVKFNDNPEYSVKYLRRALRRRGIRIKGKTRLVPFSDLIEQSKIHFFSHTSERMIDILWKQNAFSVNDIADRLGYVLGGPAAIQDYLIQELGLNHNDIYVETSSGLEHNRITTRAVIQILRRLLQRLERHNMDLHDILPVAGVDRGTLSWRFRKSTHRGAILGKTGTNSSKEGGVSSLAGLAMTRTHGPVFYAILNTQGSVLSYRRWQDEFLIKLLEDSGGVSYSLGASPKFDQIYTSSPWVASHYWQRFTQAPVYQQRSTTRTKTQVQTKSISLSQSKTTTILDQQSGQALEGDLS